MKEFLKKNKNIIIGISIFVFMLVLDIVSKRLVDNLMDIGDKVTVIPYLFNFYYTINTGGAFGIFGDSLAARIIFIIISIIASFVLGFMLIKYGKKSKALSIGVGFIIAGALGNAIDRLFAGEVIDFIQFAFWENFAIFNFADVSVIFGIVALFIYIIFIYREPKKDKKNSVNKEKLKKNDGEKAA